ncbi:cysteine synthase A [Marinobacter sp. F4216]|uniref:cysteine synthase A n=1 Tax=Marinobacter sp. F4216 TaxID=2874281 RepID=UPI001CBBC4EF|nr:cysteine synthase A [Marinobacter sp. F4216]MBZ2168835.1 cysteine synthase A [Marinobacter sp. F4216]
MTRYNSILDTIGNTPLVKLNRLAPEGVNVYVKVEAFNPMGSVKDRMAREVMEQAERSGDLKPGQTVIEATSGNTGIGLAMVCAAKGYPLVVVMSENFSVERRKLLRFLGAKVILTPAAEKGTGMLNKAVELAEAHGYYLCRQFDNDANAEIHRKTTSREILADFADEPLHFWVSGYGTGGTLKGVADVLRAESRQTQIIVAEPDNSPVLASGIPQVRNQDGSVARSHPRFRPHLMQGWAPDFISSLTEGAVTDGCIDEIIPVNGQDALTLSRRLAREEGIFAGISSGATLAAALTIAERSEPGTNIVCMLPDTGERYLSTPLFADITEDMTEEEIALSRSTQGYRFDLPPAPKAPPAPAAVPVQIVTDASVKDYTERLIDNEPVVMFALEWCEFCWAVRKLFTSLGVPYRSVDLDSVEYQANDRGGKIRSVLSESLGVSTIPQVFIGGEWIGGCSEVFAALQDGSLKERLSRSGIAITSVPKHPEKLLPQWIQPRCAS